MFFLHTYNPPRVFAHFGSFTIFWYGIMYVLAILAAIALTRWLARKKGLEATWIIDLTTILFIAGIIGARLWYVLFIEPRYFLAHPLATIAIWQGGLAIHGGIAGALVALAIWIRYHQLSFLDLTDLLAPALALGQAIGRWGNYFNQELFGSPTTLPWGIPIALENRPPHFIDALYFHPTFLYESIGNLAIVCILVRACKRYRKPGRVTFLYLLTYGILRFALEFLRIDATPTFGALRLPQWVSLVMILFGYLFIIRKRRAARYA